MTPDDQSAEVLALHIRIKQLEAALDHLARHAAGVPRSREFNGARYELLTGSLLNARAALDDRP